MATRIPKLHTCGLGIREFCSDTDQDPFRRYVKCEKYKMEGGCDYWDWIDEELPERFRSIINLRTENRRLQDELSEKNANTTGANTQLHIDTNLVDLKTMSGSTHVGGVHSEKLQKGCLATCEDLISILSDDLISNILSRLPTKDALRTSVLSRDWEYKWSSISNVDIDDIDADTPEGEATFYNFVERVLFYSLHVKSFRLLCSTPHDSNRLASWISGILRRKIEAFYFETKWDFVVPLKLTALCFENPSRICFPNLKSLTLYYVEFLNDNPIIDHLIFTFPVLETIDLHKCFWSDVKVVEFHAPELTIFKFECEVGDYTIIFNGGKLKKVTMFHYFPESINNCSTLRELDLVDLCFKVPARICFPNLMSLTLWNVEILNDNPITDRLFLTFPVLETINLIDCEWSKVKVVEIYAPELTVFKSHTMDKVNDYTISVFGGKLRVFEMSGYFPETIIVTGSQVTRATLLNWDLHLDEPFAARRRQRVRKILNGFSMQGLSSLLKLKLESHFLIEDMVEPRFRLPLPRFDKLAKLSLEGEDGMRGIKSENLLEILNAAPCLKCLEIEASPEGLWHSYDHYEVEPVPSCVISHLSEVTLNFYEREDQEPQIHLAKFFITNGKELKKLVYYEPGKSHEMETRHVLPTFQKASRCLKLVITCVIR